MYCKQHDEDGMSDVRNRWCLHDSCMQAPVKGSNTALYCKEHADDGMVGVWIKRCRHDSCQKGPSYNFERLKKPVYCKQHAEDGMVAVRSRRCEHDSCTETPFNKLKGDKTALSCKQHAKDGMANLWIKHCSYGSGENELTYNFEGKTKAVCCTQHAKDGIVDVRVPRYLQDSCTEQPSSLYDSRPPNCESDAKDEMVDGGVIHSPTDLAMVVGATQRMPTDSLTFACVQVKEEIPDGPVTSENVEAACGARGSFKRSKWGDDGEQPTHCLDHSPSESSHVVHTAHVGEVPSSESTRSTCSLSLQPYIYHNGGGSVTSAKRTSHRLYGIPVPP